MNIDDRLFDYRRKMEDMMYYIHGYIVDRDKDLFFEVKEELESAEELIHDVLMRLKFLTGGFDNDKDE